MRRRLRGAIRLPTPAEWDPIREGLPDETAHIVDVMLGLQQVTRAEIYRIDVRDVNLRSRTFTVRTTHGDAWTETIPAELIATFNSAVAHRGAGPAFPMQNGNRFYDSAFKKQWQAALVRAELDTRIVPRMAAFKTPRKTVKSAFTLAEATEELKVAVSTIEHYRKHHPVFEDRDEARGIRDDGFVFHPNGRRTPTLSAVDIRRIKRWKDRAALAQYSTIGDGARDFRFKPSLLKSMVHEQTISTFDEKYHTEASDGRLFPKRLVKTGDLVALAERRSSAIENAKGKIDAAELANRISGEQRHYQISEGAVERWLQKGSCPILKRPLEAAKVEVFVGEKRTAFVEKWIIDEAEADRINAVNLVWIPAKVVARLLNVPWNTFRKSVRRKHHRGVDWPIDEVRLFPLGRSGQTRLKASLVSRLLSADGQFLLAKEYEERVSRVLGEGEYALTADELATAAHAHWKPDTAPPANGNGRHPEKGNPAEQPDPQAVDEFEVDILTAVIEFHSKPRVGTLTLETLASELERNPDGHLKRKVASLLKRGLLWTNGKKGSGSSGYLPTDRTRDALCQFEASIAGGRTDP